MELTTSLAPVVVGGPVYLQVVGTGSMGSFPSVVLGTDNERILFDCGDGTQRLFGETNVRITKTSSIFLTSLGPPCTGGLGGMLLTRGDAAIGESTRIVGPPGTQDLIKSFRLISQRDHIKTVVEHVENNSATKWSLAAGVGEVSGYFVPPKHDEYSREFDSNDYGYVCSYLIRLADRRGTFLTQKAIDLGVPRGPMFGKLAAGESVMGTNGRLVHPNECLGEPIRGAMAGVVRCSRPHHLSALKSAESPFHGNGFACVLHFAPIEFYESAEYEAWRRESFSSETQHLFIGSGGSPEKCLNFNSDKLQWMLSSLDETTFPPPRLSTTIQSKTKGLDTTERFLLSPTKSIGLDKTNTGININPVEILETSKQLMLEMENRVVLSRDKNPYEAHTPTLTFLGTGSALPSRTRNVSSNLLRTPNGKSLLIDCGEGVYGQLCRVLGSIQAAKEEIEEKLVGVYISHMHADHHLGLLTILSMRAGRLVRQKREGTTENLISPLIIMGPGALLQFLNEFASSQNDDDAILKSFRFLDCEACEPHTEPDRPTAPAAVHLCEALDLTSIVTVPVIHCYKAYGLVVENANKWKFVYSGDTEPCPALIDVGMNCDLLLHEATFEDGREVEAAAKHHSTISQALLVGKSMKAKRIALTHFSQRYPRIPPVPQSFLENADVVVAFDLMTIPILDLYNPSASLFRMEQLQCLLKNVEEEDDLAKIENVLGE